MAVKAATIAGDPNPWDISEKCVKWRWIDESRMCCGRVLHKGDRSWFRRSMSSLVTCFVFIKISFLLYESWGWSMCGRVKYSATCRAGNSVSQTYPKSRARWIASPSTREVKSVTFAAFLRPAGRFKPIFSSFSRRSLPPFLLFARRSTPPKSEALRHSGGERRRWTSATVTCKTRTFVKNIRTAQLSSQVTTLYLLVLDKRLNRPGTEQNTSAGEPIILRPLWSFLISGKNGGESAKEIDGKIRLEI